MLQRWHRILGDTSAHAALGAPSLTEDAQPPAAHEDGKTLLNKLTQERDRLKKVKTLPWVHWFVLCTCTHPTASRPSADRR